MVEVTSMSVLAQLPRTWSYDELVEFLESFADVDPRRYEIVDGALTVSPSPDRRHEVVSALVRDLLFHAARPDYFVLGPIDVDLHPSYRAPDLIAVSAEFSRRGLRPVPASEVALAVEVVSPSSVTDDRITKPAQYAAHGIPTYLRVETEPDVTVTVYELADGAAVYTERGTWRAGETVHLDRPFALDVPVNDITP